MDGKNIQVPYLFVLEEPNYPRVMGFDFGAGDKDGTFRYEVYLPGGAEEFGIALFYQYVSIYSILRLERNTGKGLIQQEITGESFLQKGSIWRRFLPEGGTGGFGLKLFQMDVNNSR